MMVRKFILFKFSLLITSFSHTSLISLNVATKGGSISNVGIKLRDRVLKEAKVLPNDIIDVSSFMDAYVDVDLMDECGKDLAERFVRSKPNKILTIATTGLVIAIRK